MRSITIASALTLASMAVACAASRPSNVPTTTTTSAELPASDVTPAPAVEPRAAGTTTTTAATSTTTTTTSDDCAVQRGPIDPRDETMNPDNCPDSFESSGGSSGAGDIVHRKVPGQDLWGTGPSPSAPR